MSGYKDKKANAHEYFAKRVFAIINSSKPDHVKVWQIGIAADQLIKSMVVLSNKTQLNGPRIDLVHPFMD